ncbi:MAG: DUF2269 family protein [Ignavibacteriaceae bacterium]
MTIILLLKVTHIIAAILFLGNISVAILWKTLADKSRDRIRIVHTFDGIIKSDSVFTIPAVTLLIITGFGLAGMMKLSIIETGWIFLSIILVIISGVLYSIKVGPVQKKIYSLAKDETKFNWAEYESLSKQWNLWGSIATITPYIALIFMVYKYAIL